MVQLMDLIRMVVVSLVDPLDAALTGALNRRTLMSISSQLVKVEHQRNEAFLSDPK